MPSSTRNVDVKQLIDGLHLSRFQIRVMLLCGFVALLDGFDAQSISFVAAAVARELNVGIQTFGPIFGAGTLGMTIGALCLPPICDRLGRRNMIILCVVFFGLTSLTTVWVNSFSMLFVARLLTGIGVGAAVPCMIPLISEYSPSRIAHKVITVVTCCWPLGAVIGGAISAQMIPLWGWRSVFVLGGTAPLVLALVLWAYLPESIRFLVGQGGNHARIATMLRRLSPSVAIPDGAQFVETDAALRGFPVKHLFTGERASLTTLLWVSFFMNFFVLFFIFNWLPPLLQQADLPVQTAVLAAVLFNLVGTLGCIGLGILMSRLSEFAVVAAAYAVGAASVAMIGLSSSSMTLLMSAVSISGFCLVGAQACGNALIASLYPTAIRATAVGWAYGVGRAGSIVGPVVGGILLTSGWRMSELFLVVAIPLVVATLAILWLAYISPRPRESEGIQPSAVQADA